MALSPSVRSWPPFQFLNPIYTVGRTLWMGGQGVARPLLTHRITQTQNKRTKTPWVGFEPTITAFGRVKTVHALDDAATVIAWKDILMIKKSTSPTQDLVSSGECLVANLWSIVLHRIFSREDKIPLYFLSCVCACACVGLYINIQASPKFDFRFWYPLILLSRREDVLSENVVELLRSKSRHSTAAFYK
jgi:hypothetical protein